MCDGPPALRTGGASLGVSARVSSVPDDVLNMRTTAVKWNIAGLHGPFAELLLPIEERWKEKNPSLLQRGQALDTTTDSCLGSTGMDRGRASTLMC